MYSDYGEMGQFETFILMKVQYNFIKVSSVFKYNLKYLTTEFVREKKIKLIK